MCALAARGTRDVLDAMVVLGAEPDGVGPPSSPRSCSASSATASRRSRPSRRPRCARSPSASRTPRCWPRSPAPSATSATRTATTGCSPAPTTRTRTSARRSRSRSAGAPATAVLDALIALSGDAEDDVRDWATFALGTLAEADDPALRDALAARLDDPDEATRLEAVHGLAVRGDARAEAPARDLLAAHGDAEGEGVWARHLLAETASHIDA